MAVFVIAEAGSSWDCDESKAKRLIEAAKACGADAVKFQWTSNAKAMAERRLGPNAAGPTQMYQRYLEYPLETLKRLKAHCDSVSIEFMVTVYLIEDIATIAPLVKRFKVSAFESDWVDFLKAHEPYDKMTICSVNRGKSVGYRVDRALYCISKYPTALEDLGLRDYCEMGVSHDGLSDHTANVLTGAAAVAAGARIVEAHIRLHDTDEKNPDYGHSLVADKWEEEKAGAWGEPETWTHWPPFGTYVESIRTVERML